MEWIALKKRGSFSLLLAFLSLMGLFDKCECLLNYRYFSFLYICNFTFIFQKSFGDGFFSDFCYLPLFVQWNPPYRHFVSTATSLVRPIMLVTEKWPHTVL